MMVATARIAKILEGVQWSFSQMQLKAICEKRMGKMGEYMGEVVGNDAAALLKGLLDPCFILICTAAAGYIHSLGPENE